MSITPTAGSVAPHRSGRCVRHAPTSNPPLLRPLIASFGVEVYLFAISHSPAAMKSSKTFCLRSFRSGEMPLLAVLAAAAQIRHRINATHFQPHGIAR